LRTESNSYTHYVYVWFKEEDVSAPASTLLREDSSSWCHAIERDTLSEAAVSLRTVVAFVTWISRTELPSSKLVSEQYFWRRTLVLDATASLHLLITDTQYVTAWCHSIITLVETQYVWLKEEDGSAGTYAIIILSENWIQLFIQTNQIQLLHTLYHPPFLSFSLLSLHSAWKASWHPAGVICTDKHISVHWLLS